MTDKRPEQARASPKQRPIPLKLNVRFAKGGELLQWERVEVVDETVLSVSDDTPSEEYDPEGAALPRRPAEPKQISVMLILQVATFLVAIAALAVAI